MIGKHSGVFKEGFSRTMLCFAVRGCVGVKDHTSLLLELWVKQPYCPHINVLLKPLEKSWVSPEGGRGPAGSNLKVASLINRGGRALQVTWIKSLHSAQFWQPLFLGQTFRCLRLESRLDWSLVPGSQGLFESCLFAFREQTL